MATLTPQNSLWYPVSELVWMQWQREKGLPLPGIKPWPTVRNFTY